ncbi:hypothetical protein COHA_000511 [Chlorella ohadii]|uniref:RRM domain-containing protein n=1 Tax=Chlorella ohadii TaxID=2649997 RepID=A0AAD5DXS1_9CHLO|nr:hypothetical protein COHA_000511 [Chlorella ohadii]
MLEAGGVVVRVRGLPIKTTAEEVLQFLGAEGLPADAVHLRCQPRRSTGEAYVVFNTLEEAQQACGKDKDIFCPKSGDRYVRVSIEQDVRPADLVATDSAATGKVGGLPRTITPPEVLSLFWGWQVRPASTYILAATDASPHVEALVEFEVQEHAALAIAQRHGTAITTAAGVFQLSVQPASKAEWDAAVAVQQGNDGILRVKGLPPRAGAPDVLAFFQGYRVKPGGVHVQPVNDKRSKVAMVEFESAAEAARALQEKNRQQFGGTDRFCLLQLASRAELEQELAHFQQQQQQQQQQQSVPATSGKWGGSSSAGPSGIGTASGSDPGAPLPGSAGGLQSSSLAGGMPGTGGASSEANLLPQAAATAAGFLHQQPLPLPPMPMPGMPGMMPPGHMLPPGVPPMPGGWPMGPVMMGPVPMGPLPPFPMPHGFGFGHGMAAHPGAMAAAAVAASMGMPGAGGMQPWGPPGMRPFQAPNTAAARYLVQDLTTGQQVFLDPRFNLSSYGMLPPAFGSSAAATAGTTAGGTATGPARGSQQAQSELDATATSGGPAEQQPVGQAGAAAATADGSGEGSGQGPSGSGAVEAPGGAGGNGNGHSSGNGYSVAAADRHVAAMADGSGNAMLGSSRQSEQVG